MPKETRFQKANKYLVIFSPILIIAFFFLSQRLGLESICLWKFLTGHECWGCGITHAIIALMRLDFRAAYEYNPVVFIVAPLLFVAWVKYIIKKIYQ